MKVLKKSYMTRRIRILPKGHTQLGLDLFLIGLNCHFGRCLVKNSTVIGSAARRSAHSRLIGCLSGD